MSSPYDVAADDWAAGAEPVYARLADALLDAAPVRLQGIRVLDVGSGTGVAARAAVRGDAATVVAVDVAARMLARRGAGIAAVVADARRLPFAGGSFDLVTSAFCLSHLSDPATALLEAHRVAGALVASAFAPGPEPPAKTAVDEVLARYGYVVPDWYAAVKDASTRVEDPVALDAMTRSAGFTHVRVLQRAVDTGLRTPAEVVRWRWGMAQAVPFVRALEPGAAQRARAECAQAVAEMLPVRIRMLVLSAS